MAYLLIQENDTTQLAIGPIRGFQAVDGELHIKLDAEELRAWHTVTGWEVRGDVLTTRVAEQQVTIKNKKYDLGKMAGMGDCYADQINKKYLLKDAPTGKEIYQYIFDMEPTEFEALSLLSGV